MTSDERKIVARKWAALSSSYSRVFSNDAWAMMLKAVEDLPAERLVNALDAWMGSARARQFPMPIDLREMVVPPVNDEDVSREAASRVIAAVGKFGWAQGAAAREWIGELGWIAVVRAGGWAYVCENLGKRDFPQGMFQAQVRDLLQSQVRLAKAGKHDQPIGLPEAASSQVLELAAGTVRALDARRNDKR